MLAILHVPNGGVGLGRVRIGRGGGREKSTRNAQPGPLICGTLSLATIIARTSRNTNTTQERERAWMEFQHPQIPAEAGRCMHVLRESTTVVKIADTCNVVGFFCLPQNPRQIYSSAVVLPSYTT